jgi:hypothetical protein
VAGELQCRRLWEMEKGKMGRRRGSSTMLLAYNIAKSDAVAGQAEGSGWHLEVEDDQRKLGRWAECAVGSNC